MLLQHPGVRLRKEMLLVVVTLDTSRSERLELRNVRRLVHIETLAGRV